VVVGGWHCFFIASFHQYNIHDWWQNDVMSKISFENVTKIKSFKIWLKNNYENEVDKMMCHYKNNVVIQLFYNDSKMTISNLIWVQMDIVNYNM